MTPASISGPNTEMALIALASSANSAKRPRRRKRHRATDVDHQRNPDREKRTERNAFAGIAEIPGHAHPLGKTGDRRKEDGEDQPERRRLFRGSPSWPRAGRCPNRRMRPSRKDSSAAAITAMMTYWKREAQSDTQPGQHEQARHRRGGHHLHCPRALPSKNLRRDLGEADAIEPDGDRLRAEQHETDRAAELEAEGARDQVVVPTALDLEVCGDRRDRQAGQNRNHIGDEDDHQSLRQPGAADDILQFQKQNEARVWSECSA